MKQNKFYLLAGVLGLIITTLSVSAVASAYQGKANSGAQFDTERFQVMQEERQALDDAISSRNYQAWKEIIDSRPRITDYVTAENFDQFAQMHELRQSGKFDEAQLIAQELGLPENMSEMKGFGHGRMMGHRPNAQNQEVKQ